MLTIAPNCFTLFDSSEKFSNDELTDRTMREWASFAERVLKSSGALPPALKMLTVFSGDALPSWDAWGRELELKKNDQKWEIVSSGPDGLRGTDDDLIVELDLK